jgi:cell division protein FtsI (penicillin-binding protein 3)
MSFGYGLSVTPVQLITAFSALVNGGILYKPQLVKQQADWRGRDIYNFAPLKIRQVISKETSNRIKKLLISTIENGTGYSAKSKVISIGGKTGTSKIAKDGGYSSGINSSFVGFFPAQNPKAVCLILVDSPELEKYGGKVAAPIFRNIAERIVKNNPGLFFEYEQPEDRKVDDADQNIPVVYSDNSNDQNKTRYSFSSNIEFTKDRMPDLRGKTIKEALSVLNEIGLKYSIKGTGIVNSQSIQPGSNLKQNTVCVLDCQPDEIEGANLY